MDKSRPELPDIDFDTEASKRLKIFNAVQDYFNTIGASAINVCTFTTLGAKSALRVAGKGLNIDITILNYLVSLVPTERGVDWTLQQCMFGDDEHTKIQNFIKQMSVYPQLWQVASYIEGLVTNLSVHASGVLIINGKITEHNSIMKTSSNVRVTAWELHDSEAMGGLKYDFLTIEALDKIRTCLNLLLEDGLLQWQGSLQSTYNKYLLPANLNYHDTNVWNHISNGDITELFQFDTIVGGRAIKLIKPNSLKDLAAGNSIMRLMSEDREQPIDVFIRNKTNIQRWYEEMNNWGLTADEVKLLENYLMPVYGVAPSQEIVMRLSMDSHIAGFDLKQANALRKGIAKKKPAIIEKTRQLFYQKGQEQHTSMQLLDYVWKRQIGMSLGYSFSDLHTVAYSTIALQEATLYCNYNPVYWNCACLSVNANAINNEDYNFLIDEDIVQLDSEDDKDTTKKASSVAYDKIAIAIDKIKDIITIVPPDINRSKIGFSPNAAENSIISGLKGIGRIGDDIIADIIMRRPYGGLKDFMQKMVVNGKKLISIDRIVNLIKAGCFDRIEGKPREQIMKDFLCLSVSRHANLTLSNFLGLIKADLVPDSLKNQRAIYLLTKELRKNKTDNGFYIINDELVLAIYRKYVGKDPTSFNSVFMVDQHKWDEYYNKVMDSVRTWIAANKLSLIDKMYSIDYEEQRMKYADGDILQWELDSLGFYRQGHPLMDLKLDVEITPLNELISEESDGIFLIKGVPVPKMKLRTIVGTVIGKNKVSGVVILSTPQGIIKTKVYKNMYAKYDKAIIDDNKNVLQRGFFDKGTHLMVTGCLRDDIFVPKVYKQTLYPPFVKIILNEDNSFCRYEEKQ